MADKYLKRDSSSGYKQEVEATVTSAGVGNAGDIVALDGTGKLSETVMPVGIGAETKILPATENLSAGDLVNIYDASGTPSCRKADAATSGKEANGFVLASVTTGQDATVYTAGINTGLTSLTGGSRYYLSDVTAGAVTATPVTGTGKAHQYVGKALSSSEIEFEEGEVIILA